MDLALLVVVCNLCVAVYYYCAPRTIPGMRRMPGSSWLAGDLFTLRANLHQLNDLFLAVHTRFGVDSYQVLLPGERPIVNLSPSPRNMEWILGTHADAYPKDPAQVGMYRELLGHGIFASDGVEWRAERKIASRMFSTRVLRDTLAGTAGAHAEAMRTTLDTHPAGLDMQAMFHRCTAATFLETGFGVPYTSRTAAVMQAFDRVGAGLFSRYIRPAWRLQRLLGLGVERQIAADLRTLEAFAAECIAGARARGDPSAPDLLSLYIRDAASADDASLRDMVFNFILAGRDTTASLLTWTLYRLMKHPRVADRCRAELEGVLAEETTGRLGHRGAASCTYLDAVLHEVLRLHPPIPSDVKSCPAGDVLPDGTVVPAGATVAYRPYVFGRSALLWDNPAVFDPGRWGVACSPYKFIAFNAGRRICLGRGSALLQAKIVLATLLPRYTFTMCTPGEPEWRPAAVLTMRDGLRVSVQPRHAAQLGRYPVSTAW
jgi:cytochrome P450